MYIHIIHYFLYINKMYIYKIYHESLQPLDAPEMFTVLPFITSIAVLTMFPTAGSLSATRSIMSAGTCQQHFKSERTPSCMASFSFSPEGQEAAAKDVAFIQV